MVMLARWVNVSAVALFTAGALPPVRPFPRLTNDPANLQHHEQCRREQGRAL